jgi:hypothetical protein
MNWSISHRESEELAATAHEIRRTGDKAGAEVLFEQAARAEIRALTSLGSDKPRTLGITAVSAVALLCKAGKLEEAERLAHRASIMDGMPVSALNELRGLLQAIWNERPQKSAMEATASGEVPETTKGVNRPLIRQQSSDDRPDDSVPENPSVDFLGRLFSAESALETEILASVPDGISLKARAGRSFLVTPDDNGYAHILRQFRQAVSDERSRVILAFLYGFEKYLSKDINIFSENYGPYFSSRPDKWKAVLYHFPRIDQTALSIILEPIPSTILAYRLEGLESIGLVDRGTSRPPMPRHVRISSKGVFVVEAAVQKAMTLLSPIFDRREITDQAESLADNSPYRH